MKGTRNSNHGETVCPTQGPRRQKRRSWKTRGSHPGARDDAGDDTGGDARKGFMGMEVMGAMVCPGVAGSLSWLISAIYGTYLEVQDTL